MTTQCVVRAAECNSPWRGKCPKDKRGPSPARGPSRNETPDIPGGTYCLIKYGLYVIPSGFEVKGFPHPPLRGPPSPKGRPTDTEAIYREVVGEGETSTRRIYNLSPFPFPLSLIKR